MHTHAFIERLSSIEIVPILRADFPLVALNYQTGKFPKLFLINDLRNICQSVRASVRFPRPICVH